MDLILDLLESYRKEPRGWLRHNNPITNSSIFSKLFSALITHSYYFLRLRFLPSSFIFCKLYCFHLLSFVRIFLKGFSTSGRILKRRKIVIIWKSDSLYESIGREVGIKGSFRTLIHLSIFLISLLLIAYIILFYI